MRREDNIVKSLKELKAIIILKQQEKESNKFPNKVNDSIFEDKSIQQSFLTTGTLIQEEKMKVSSNGL